MPGSRRRLAPPPLCPSRWRCSPRAVALERRHVRRPGRHAGLPQLPDPAVPSPRDPVAAPALVVLAIGVDPTAVLRLSEVVLSFGIPLALVPLILLTRRADLMGTLVNRTHTTVIASIVAALIIGLNGVPGSGRRSSSEVDGGLPVGEHRPGDARESEGTRAPSPGPRSATGLNGRPRCAHQHGPPRGARALRRVAPAQAAAWPGLRGLRPRRRAAGDRLGAARRRREAWSWTATRATTGTPAR